MRTALLAGCLFLLTQSSSSCAAPLGERRQQANATGTGFLTVTSEPPGLPVLLDGMPAGVTPLEKLEVAAGAHTVRVGGPCYVESRDAVDAVAGDERRVSVAPVAREAELEVRAKDAEKYELAADVLVDGQRVGTTPGRFTVPVCSKEVEARYPGLGSVRKTLDLTEKRVNEPWVAEYDRPSDDIDVKLGLLGSLSMEAIRRGIRSHQDPIKACYESALSRNPDMGGMIKLRFVISEKGSVSMAKAVETTLNDSLMEDCLLMEVLTWKFPEPTGGGRVIVNYPFVFRPRQ